MCREFRWQVATVAGTVEEKIAEETKADAVPDRDEIVLSELELRGELTNQLPDAVEKQRKNRRLKKTQYTRSLSGLKTSSQ